MESTIVNRQDVDYRRETQQASREIRFLIFKLDFLTFMPRVLVTRRSNKKYLIDCVNEKKKYCSR